MIMKKKSSDVIAGVKIYRNEKKFIGAFSVPTSLMIKQKFLQWKWIEKIYPMIIPEELASVVF